MPTFRNPKLNGTHRTARLLISALPRFPSARFTVTGSIPIPTFNGNGPVQDARYHYQGIAPFNIDRQSPSNAVICASSTVASFSLFNQLNEVGTLMSSAPVVTVPDENYFHAGGMQMLGGLLPVPLESSDSNRKGI